MHCKLNSTQPTKTRSAGPSRASRRRLHPPRFTGHALPGTAPCREAYCSTGYSPVLAFDVDDLQSTLVRCLERGATMDGSIQHSPHGKASKQRGSGVVVGGCVCGGGGGGGWLAGRLAGAELHCFGLAD